MGRKTINVEKLRLVCFGSLARKRWYFKVLLEIFFSDTVLVKTLIQINIIHKNPRSPSKDNHICLTFIMIYLNTYFLSISGCGSWPRKSFRMNSASLFEWLCISFVYWPDSQSIKHPSKHSSTYRFAQWFCKHTL